MATGTKLYYGMHLRRETWDVARVRCSLTNATVPPATSFPTAACQHGGRDERETVEKVSKVLDVEGHPRARGTSVRRDAPRSIAPAARNARLLLSLTT